MSTTTQKHGLVKPDKTDFYDIEEYNQMLDEIDNFYSPTNKPTATDVGALPISGYISDNYNVDNLIDGLYMYNGYAHQSIIHNTIDLPFTGDFGFWIRKAQSLGSIANVDVAINTGTGRIYVRKLQERTWKEITYLPSSGGTLTGSYIGFANDSARITGNQNYVYLTSNPTGGDARYLTLYSSTMPNENDIKRALRLQSGTNLYNLFGEHNKDDLPSLTVKGSLKIDTTNPYLFFGNTSASALYGSADGNMQMESRNVSSGVVDTKNRRMLNLRASAYGTSGTDLNSSIRLIDIVNNVLTSYMLYGQHNKPTGTYSGNGSSASRTVNIGGLGQTLFLTSTNGCAYVSIHGAFCWGGSSYSGSPYYYPNSYIKFQGGVLTITTTNGYFNENGVTYSYEVL